MRVLVVERNLIWGPRLANSARGAGHETELVSGPPFEGEFDVAILNLADAQLEWVDTLHAAGVKVIAHAGHKEGEKLLSGKEMGCDIIATNGEITAKLPAILDRAAKLPKVPATRT
jgi:hypothetical protein